MRKRIVSAAQHNELESDRQWIDLEALAEVEITSEDPMHPIESALIANRNGGWCANKPGRQMIRLKFSSPQDIRFIRLEFEEKSVVRTQEYVLRWAPEYGRACQEIVRQQWNFNPEGAVTETEEHEVDLHGCAVLELVIDPGLSEPAAFASLKSLQLGRQG